MELAKKHAGGCLQDLTRGVDDDGSSVEQDVVVGHKHSALLGALKPLCVRSRARMWAASAYGPLSVVRRAVSGRAALREAVAATRRRIDRNDRTPA